uniref:Fatty acyl-CoA reductase C-terminal domain-containing protein n=1 Tax=Kalanchoe fedtschenkoi TaxID=63787 RepID=A0A7N0THH0_KALFE
MLSNPDMLYICASKFQMLEVANIACCSYFDDFYTTAKRKIDVVMRLAELYRPYLFFKAIFDDKNTDMLRAATRNSMDSEDVFHFQFDPLTINWEDYMMNVHFPSVVKHLFK